MIAQLDIDKYQRLMKDYATTDRNCRLASPKGFTAIVRMMEALMPEYYSSISQTDYLNFIMNTIWYNREFLGKSGHALESDCRKCLDVVGQAPAGMITGPILIPEIMPENERQRVQAALEKYHASQHTNRKTEPEPEPEPEPSNQTPLTISEPTEPVGFEPIKTYSFTKPTRPGYIVPEEYPMIHYALSNNIDVLLTGDPSAGKSLLGEVICETEHWNFVPIGKVTDDTMLKGFMNPITKEYTPSKLVRALQRDPELCPYDGQKVVICFDEGFTNMGDYLTTLLSLVGTPDGYLATEFGIVPRGDAVFLFIDNTTGDGGTTNFISRKPVDMALKSRLFLIEMKLSPKVAKAICMGDKDLLKFTEWMRKAIGKGKVDRLNLDNRGLQMIRDMKNWDDYCDGILETILYGAFFKGCPPASIATLLRNIDARPEELRANKYFMATQRYYTKLCERVGLNIDPNCIRA